MGAIGRALANSLTTGGVVSASAINNTSVTNVTTLPIGVDTGDLVLISSQTASASATISFTTGLDSTYDEYIFKFIDIHPATDVTHFQFQGDTGTNTNYNQTITSTSFRSFHYENDTSTGLQYFTGGDQAQGTAFQMLAENVGNDNDQSCSGTLTIFNPASATFVKHFIARVQYSDSDDRTREHYVAGYFNLTTPLTRFQFKMSSGNIDDGIIKLYGVKKS
jgi:hypothetical protein